MHNDDRNVEESYKAACKEGAGEGKKYIPELEAYIKSHYIESEPKEEQSSGGLEAVHTFIGSVFSRASKRSVPSSEAEESLSSTVDDLCDAECAKAEELFAEPIITPRPAPMLYAEKVEFDPQNDDSFYELEDKLNARLKHIKDSFSDYLMYLIEVKGMTPAEVYNNSIVSKKLFSKIKTNPEYHPSKEVALRLCVGARLNIDDSKDLLSRAGYTFSPCELYDLIFEFFIENEIYDIVEIAIQLEEHGLESFIDS